MWLALWLVFTSAPEVKLPPKSEVIPSLTPGRPELADAIRAGVRAARPALEKCLSRDGGVGCLCKALEQVRFGITLDGGTVVITYPLPGHTGPSFTLDAAGKVISCTP